MTAATACWYVVVILVCRAWLCCPMSAQVATLVVLIATLGVGPLLPQYCFLMATVCMLCSIALSLDTCPPVDIA